MDRSSQPRPGTVVVVAGGDAPDPNVLDHPSIVGDILVIGADSGVGHALGLGLRVDIAVGDFDSIAAADLERVRAAGVDLRPHPQDKDATDLELALDIALSTGAERIVMIGGHGGRLDHLLGNAMVLAAPRYAGARLTALMGPAVVTVVHPGPELELSGRPGESLTLLAVHGPVTGLHLDGAVWSLVDATLAPGSSLGVSNRFAEPIVQVRIASGTLLLIQPGDHP